MTAGLFAAVSGVRANQTRINVISNNIANVNTVGFKSSSVNFATVFASTITGGNAPTGTLGGTNPKQLGSGVSVAEIPSNFNQGGTQFTGRNTDLMINGEGFFAVERVDSNLGTENSAFYLTRAGNFSLDSSGNLVSSSGNRVRGTSQLSGTDPTTLTSIKIPQEMLIVKDLDANGGIVGTHFAQVGTAGSDITAAMASSATSQNIAAVKLVNFSIGSDGAITATYSNGDRISVRTDVSTLSPTDPTAARREIIHLPAEGGTFGADNDGNGSPSQATDGGIVNQINEVFTAPTGGNALEGMQLQLQTATVTNPAGLMYDSNNNFLPGPNSGTTNFGVPANENRGNLQTGSLESSNVDLAAEFTSLIVAQRGLEAGSKVIRAQSEVMQSIINII
jgi:flagellar hook protein FlgE